MNKQLFLQIALQWLNTPYKWAGASFEGIDCSGFAQELLATVGLDPAGDQTADALFRHFLSPRRGNIGVCDVGSLCFFGKQALVTHVGVAIAIDTMIEAGGGGPRTITRADAAAQAAFVRVRPISSRTDLVSIIQPQLLPWAQVPLGTRVP